MRLGWAPLLVAAVIGAAASAGGSWAVREAHHRPENLHDIIHHRFKLTGAEHDRLEAAEARYEQRRTALEARIHAVNVDLADAIRQDPEMSPRVLAASSAVETTAAELQRVTLQHIFEMRAALDPDHRSAYDAVLVDALTRDR